MENRITLARLKEMGSGGLEGLPIDQIAMLLEDIDADRTALKVVSEAAQAELDRRFGGIAANARKSLSVSVGSVNLTEGEFAIRADLPKKVDWDQAKLREAVSTLLGMDENPDEYVSYDIKVTESKYGAWTSKIRALFDPARTVGIGRASYKVTPAKKAA